MEKSQMPKNNLTDLCEAYKSILFQDIKEDSIHGDSYHVL